MLEYKTVTLIGGNPHNSLEQVLNQYSADGWTFVQLADRLVIFSRDVQPEQHHERPILRR
jgi:Domain of unknown function (DUF4177)